MLGFLCEALFSLDDLLFGPDLSENDKIFGTSPFLVFFPLGGLCQLALFDDFLLKVQIQVLNQTYSSVDKKVPNSDVCNAQNQSIKQ